MFTGLALILSFLSPQSTRAASPTTPKEQSSAIHAIATLAAEAPDRLDPVLGRIGFPVESATQEWGRFPVVRKLEIAYAAAEKAGPGGGTQMLALLAQDLKGRYESVAYEPALRPLLMIPAKPPVAFQSGDLPPPPVLEPSKRGAIATISRYSEGGALGGPQGILEHYFDLPSSTTYDILRKAKTPEEALVMGLAFVPERERDPVLQRVVTRMDRVYESAHAERVLDPYRLSPRKPEAVLAEITKQPGFGRDNAGGRGATDPNVPPGGGGIGGSPGVSGAGGPPQSNPSPVRPGEVPFAEGPLRTEARTAPASAGERYLRFVETNYPVAAGRTFTSMIEIPEGFGGVVLGNKVTSAVLQKPTQLIWMQHTDDAAKGATGEIRIRLADGTEKFYGPVDAEDAYAAALMVRGAFGLSPYVNGEGVGLVSLNQRDARPSFTPDNRVVWEARWDVTLHPALARLRLGRNVLMCDATPIQRDGFLDLVRVNRGLSRADALAGVFTKDITNWKITDAPLQITASGSRIRVLRAYDAANPLSLDYRQQTFLSMQGFEEEDPASKDFTAKFDKFMPDLILSSEHYQRLNDFAAVFALYRWASSQKALLLNTPSDPRLLDPVPPSLILTDKGEFELAGNSTEADVLRDFYREGEQRFNAISATLPPALRTVAVQAAGSRREIQDQQIKLAELEEKLENVRLDFRALSLRLEEKIPQADLDKRDELLKLEDRVEIEIRESAHNRPVAAGGPSASARLSSFAATINPALEKQLLPVLGEYGRITAELRVLEKAADEAQMSLHQQVLMALIADGAGYTAQYQKVKLAYSGALAELESAVSKEAAERDRWEKDPARNVSELLGVLMGTEAMDMVRSDLLQTDSDDSRKLLAQMESEVESRIAATKPTTYGQSIRVTDAALAKSADARKAFGDLLESRDADLTKRYPDWATWWALITCSRHSSTRHLDYDMAIGD
jgi:hypothetical protein